MRAVSHFRPAMSSRETWRDEGASGCGSLDGVAARADGSGLMAKGFQENQERVARLAGLGKDLARRARSKCELCEAAGVSLKIYEVPPVPAEPDFDRCLMLCGDCHSAAENPRRFEPGERWRCLAQTIWSEVPAAQVMALRLLRRQAATQPWAREALEEAYVDPEIEAWAEKGE